MFLGKVCGIVASPLVKKLNKQRSEIGQDLRRRDDKGCSMWLGLLGCMDVGVLPPVVTRREASPLRDRILGGVGLTGKTKAE